MKKQKVHIICCVVKVTYNNDSIGPSRTADFGFKKGAVCGRPLSPRSGVEGVTEEVWVHTGPSKENSETLQE